MSSKLSSSPPNQTFNHVSFIFVSQKRLQ
jgi:hypothetical protein